MSTVGFLYRVFVDVFSGFMERHPGIELADYPWLRVDERVEDDVLDRFLAENAPGAGVAMRFDSYPAPPVRYRRETEVFHRRDTHLAYRRATRVDRPQR